MADTTQHASDCAVHNPPAKPAGECDCPVKYEHITDDQLRNTSAVLALGLSMRDAKAILAFRAAIAKATA